MARPHPDRTEIFAALSAGLIAGGSVLIGLGDLGVQILGAVLVLSGAYTIAALFIPRLPLPEPRERPKPQLSPVVTSETATTFLFPTPAEKLSLLIEEGERNLRYLPDVARTGQPSGKPSTEDSRNTLAAMMAGFDIDYPARLYEWEARVWRLITEPMSPLNQYRALYSYHDKAVRLPLIEAHYKARLEELRAILAKV
jgi:hypothetical protein